MYTTLKMRTCLGQASTTLVVLVVVQMWWKFNQQYFGDIKISLSISDVMHCNFSLKVREKGLTMCSLSHKVRYGDESDDVRKVDDKITQMDDPT